MSPQLQKALDELAKLPVQEQEAFAEWMLEELAERHWEQLFEDNDDLLVQLADEALAEHRTGKARV